MDSFVFVLRRDFTMLEGGAQKVPNHLKCVCVWGGGGCAKLREPSKFIGSSLHIRQPAAAKLQRNKCT